LARNYAVLLGQHEQFVDKLLLGYLGFSFRVEGEVFVDPNSPLIASINRNHGLCGLEKSKNVDENFEAD
jgi:hypothetical protein